ncbi:hypothetical protein L2735_04305 [Shewanella olleyana]|uniref:hypothetical protein n=1 Tax=Shewanella olleyana TaxID=135626 RepID=UPI00200C9321|nr:hypothetical protein [Shewanella olleyana]MCL1066028.1 hypothetical protein [Shewanella olleyana]
MKHSGLIALGLLLALGCLFLGLQMGKKQLNQFEVTQVEVSQPSTEINNSAKNLSSELKNESTQLITELKKEVKQLKQELAEKNTLIDAMNSSMGLLEQQVEIAYTEIDEAADQNTSSPFHPEPASITPEQARQWVPEAFASVIANQQGDMIELFKRHHQAEISTDWAANREQELRDAIAISEFSNDVNIESITCKTTTCEIRGFELAPNSWMEVSQQVQGGSLGKNVSTWSYLAGNENGDTLIYMLSEVGGTRIETTNKDN